MESAKRMPPSDPRFPFTKLKIGDSTMNYLYYDNQTGEHFYVNADNRDSADRIAYFYFDDYEFICIDDDITAEMSGYDTY